jgi:hypothetical protein
MTRIAITGHRGLSDEVEALVDLALRKELTRHADGLVGISCLADGADQLFARAVLDLGGELEAVVPAARYRDGLPAGPPAPDFRLPLAGGGELSLPDYRGQRVLTAALGALCADLCPLPGVPPPEITRYPSS